MTEAGGIPGETDQSEAIEFLTGGAGRGVARENVIRIDTHGALVFLIGDRALKLKRAIRFAYMDFSTLDRRHRACQAELALNRVTAPEIYLGVRAITRADDGTLALDGAGEPIDWLVEMVRYDESALLDQVARQGAFGDHLAGALADAIATFHDQAERHREPGGADALRAVAATNAGEMRRFGAGVLEAAAIDRLEAALEHEISGHEALIESRRAGGWVRRCHGDLHLRNVVLWEGRPLLVDALEFDERLATTDVLYDLAFLLMDLWWRGLERPANQVMNRYFWHGSDLSGLALMPLFMALRAGIRAHVSANMATWQARADESDRLRRAARSYLDLAHTFLEAEPARLVAVGGLSGSGKSTIAATLAPRIGRPPGAVVLRSDVIRKEIMGVAPSEPLGPEGYRGAVTERVYRRLRERAEQALSAGQSVIADAVHGREDERQAIEAVAKAKGARFDGLWLEAPAARLALRIEGRRNDPSDATVPVMEAQARTLEVPATWTRLDAAGEVEAVAETARRALAG